MTGIKISDDIVESYKPGQHVFQACEDGYLVYTPPQGETEGRFKMETGGLVWFSDKFPEGECATTRWLSKEEGDIIINRLKQAMEGKRTRIEG